MSNNSNKILQMLGGFIAFGFALLEELIGYSPNTKLTAFILI